MENEDDDADIKAAHATIFEKHFSLDAASKIILAIPDDPERIVSWTSHYEDGVGRRTESLKLKEALRRNLNSLATYAEFESTPKGKSTSDIKKDLKSVVNACEMLRSKLINNESTSNSLYNRLISAFNAPENASSINQIFSDLEPSPYKIAGESFTEYHGDIALRKTIEVVGLLLKAASHAHGKVSINLENSKNDKRNKGDIFAQTITDGVLDNWINLLGNDFTQTSVPWDGSAGASGGLINFIGAIFSVLNISGDSEALRARIRRSQNYKSLNGQVKSS